MQTRNKYLNCRGLYTLAHVRYFPKFIHKEEKRKAHQYANEEQILELQRNDLNLIMKYCCPTKIWYHIKQLIFLKMSKFVPFGFNRSTMILWVVMLASLMPLPHSKNISIFECHSSSVTHQAIWSFALCICSIEVYKSIKHDSLILIQIKINDWISLTTVSFMASSLYNWLNQPIQSGF